MTRDDIPSYTDEFWSEEARAELKAKLALVPDDRLRGIIFLLLDTPADLLVPALRGAISGSVPEEKPYVS